MRGKWPQSGSVSVWSVLGILLIVMVVGAVLFPIFARARRCPCAPQCESNLKQIGNATKMYLSDWDNTYPTNRTLLTNGKPGRMTSHAELSPLDSLTQSGEHPKFVHSINWVEGLYSYVEAVTKKEDTSSVWRCDRASGDVFPPDSETARVSYVLNRNLIERKEGLVRGPQETMMAREMDRLVEAELRPTNDSMWTSKRPPISPFLTNHDNRIGNTNDALHGDGSNILYADGHVRCLDNKSLSRKVRWDSTTRRWYGSFGSPAIRSGRVIIAVTP